MIEIKANEIKSVKVSKEFQGELYNKDNGKRIPLICHAEYLKRLRKDYPLVIWNNN